MQLSRFSIQSEAIRAFAEYFGAPPTHAATAPGRVNLIGEHTDYNDGFVLPTTIDRVTAVAISLRSDGKLDMAAADLHSRILASLDDLAPTPIATWSNYIKGVAHLLRAQGVPFRGANVCLLGNVPRGSGLSSSAALEVATAYAILGATGATLPDLEIIRTCQRAEHEWAGVKCGIMDQFISCLGKKGHALFLDCRTLEYRHVPIPAAVQLLVCDTGVRRALAASEYNKRRSECATGVRILSGAHPGITALRDLSSDQFAGSASLLEPVVRQRCKHVILENERVQEAVNALDAGDLSRFGKLMYDSHFSLRHDYEVSCRELDAMVDICAEEEGVYGARMTGAGFGGCAICLVSEEHARGVMARIQKEYPQQTGKTPVLYLCYPEDGAQVNAV